MEEKRENKVIKFVKEHKKEIVIVAGAAVIGGVIGYKLKGESKLIKDLRDFDNNLENDILKISSKSNRCTTINALGELCLPDLNYLGDFLCNDPAHTPEDTVTGVAVFCKETV